MVQYLQNAKGVDTIILTLNKPTQINTVTITGAHFGTKTVMPGPVAA